MRFLLPPSETKRDGSRDVSLRVESMVAPQLTAPRTRVIDALSKYCAKPSTRVRAAIGTSASQDAELARNVVLRSAPTAPAFEVYDGVLFDAIELGTASAAVHARIVERVLVQSALFGVVGFGDHIPAYRCSADSALPRIGRVGSFWRTRLDAAMNELSDNHLILDLRSGPYASMWKPAGAMAERTATVRVMQMRGGRKLAVSHFNKATKGQIVRALCSTSAELRTADDAANRLAKAGFDVDVLRLRSDFTIEVMMRTPGA